MAESFYDPIEHWSDSVAWEYQESTTVEDRLASEPVTYEDIAASWQEYQDSEEEYYSQPVAVTTNSLIHPVNTWTRFADHITSFYTTRFDVRLDNGSVWPCYLYNYSLVTLPVYSNMPVEYGGYDYFTGPRPLVNFFLGLSGLPALQDEDNPLAYIWTCGSAPQTWEQISFDYM